MLLKSLTPRQSLNKAYLKEKISRNEFENFKENLVKLFTGIDHEEREENTKTILRDFLNNTYYRDKHFINTLRDVDLVIYLENNQDKAAVLAEVKRPKNKLEMIAKDNLNVKAMHELILYYLEERIDHKNNDIKFLIVTNIYEWFIFDAAVFEHLFFNNKLLVKNYERWRDKQKTSGNTALFYNEIAKPFLDDLKSEIPFTYFDIGELKKSISKNDGENEKKLIALYKILSPVHLLKQPFTNDSNSLDRNFYNELLHIIGLVETKEKNKKLINRKPEKERDPGSIIENAILILETENTLAKINNPEKYGETKNDRLYNLALELSITWVNRILFLKLLEAQLYKYHNNDKYKFLNKTIVNDFDELYKLFHQVLAIPTKERTALINKKFGLVPYLNSSLFEISELESETIKVNSLDDNTPVELYKNTILKDISGKKQSEKLSVLHYLFEFLDAYDFTSEGKEEIQEDKKTLINASVLGLIFEKINGYKDGSFFTPGFITMYMCRETLRRAVVQKFNDKYNWKCETLNDIKNHLAPKRNTGDILEYNSVINSIKICDPAVGSGHFLVSALNELISIKSELAILADSNGTLLSDYEAKVENDELIITYNNGEEIFEYHPPIHKKAGEANKLQRVQETLFNEKQTIIENCLFGVDINPNSVKIARLRLWIELLKNAFYTKESGYAELETLPNIDINIKEGNSLISRFDLDADLKNTLKTIRYTIDDYKNFVRDYKNTNNKEEKNNFKRFIDDIKSNFKTEIGNNDPRRKKLNNLVYELHNKYQTERLFGKDDLQEKQKQKIKQEEKKLQNEINKLSEELEAEKNNVIYKNAFEWRFEFPEVLDDNGKFVGFDVVIGNPPYVSNKEMHKLKMQRIIRELENNYQSANSGNFDLYIPFIERGLDILRLNGELTNILPNKLLLAKYSKSILNIIFKKYTFLEFSDLSEYPVFEEASVYPIIIRLLKVLSKEKNTKKVRVTVNGNIEKREISNWDYLSQSIQKESNNDVSVLLDKMDKVETINSKLSFSPGINGFQFTNYNKCVTEGLIEKKSKRLVVTGSIDPYCLLKKPTKYKGINYNEPYIFFDQDIISEGKWELFSKPKILIAGMAKRIEALLDENGEMAPGVSVYNISGDTENLKFILGLLNSKLINWYFQVRFKDKHLAGGYISINNTLISKLPFIKCGDSSSIKVIENSVTKIIAQKRLKHETNTDELETEIDKLVYQLYGLTEEEINIVEGK